jgi:hypothetical protein
LRKPFGCTIFFNSGEKGDMMLNKSNLDIENELLALADKRGVKIDKEDYPRPY